MKNDRSNGRASSVLLIEDDRELARQLRADLSEDGFEMRVETRGPEGLHAALGQSWDVVILDISLPGVNGFEILQQLRVNNAETAVICLTARGEVADRVRGLHLGADDYLTKPFAKDELKARLHALLRRTSSRRPSALSVGPAVPKGWVINSPLRQVTMGGETVALQPREWSVLEFFLQHEGQVLTKSHLLDRVWGIQFDPGTNVVDAVICRLRGKLQRPGQPSHLKTSRGRGYIFQRDV